MPIAVIAIILAALGIAYSMNQSAASSGTDTAAPADTGTDSDGFIFPDTSPPGPLTNDHGVIVQVDPTNRSTWPSGDKIWQLAQAIALAEGYNIPGSNPARLNNPGDISDGGKTYGFESHSGSDVTKFPDAETGWRWLYNKLGNILAGGSHVYSANMTFVQFAQKWAGNWQAWATNVTRELAVTQGTTLTDWFNS